MEGDEWPDDRDQRDVGRLVLRAERVRWTASDFFQKLKNGIRNEACNIQFEVGSP